MSEVLRAIAGAMQADVATLRAISQNIANAEVPAYRRQIPLAATRFEELLSSSLADGSTPAAQSDVQWDAVGTDETPGTLKGTGEPLHVAIEGGGYFQLQSDQGAVLTRRGDFHVSAEGLLTAASGAPVLGIAGPIELGTATPTIASDGTVRVADNLVGQLKIVTAAQDSPLQYVGDALYVLLNDDVTTVEQPTVRQGFLEAGNVTPVQEMVHMMETLRHFETAQRFLLGYDELRQQAISELGRVDF